MKHNNTSNSTTNLALKTWAIIHQNITLQTYINMSDHIMSTWTTPPLYYQETDPIDPDHGDAEITPEMGDNYLSAEIMLPRGGTMVKGRVATRKRDNAGNLIGLANANPILDT